MSCENCSIKKMIDMGCCTYGHQPGEAGTKILINSVGRRVEVCEYLSPEGSGNRCQNPNRPPLCREFNCGEAGWGK